MQGRQNVHRLTPAIGDASVRPAFRIPRTPHRCCHLDFLQRWRAGAGPPAQKPPGNHLILLIAVINVHEGVLYPEAGGSGALAPSRRLALCCRGAGHATCHLRPRVENRPHTASPLGLHCGQARRCRHAAVGYPMTHPVHVIGGQYVFSTKQRCGFLQGVRFLGVLAQLGRRRVLAGLRRRTPLFLTQLTHAVCELAVSVIALTVHKQHRAEFRSAQQRVHLVQAMGELALILLSAATLREERTQLRLVELPARHCRANDFATAGSLTTLAGVVGVH
mmetsp:Transcript_10349/g.26777  ORF Transcript_10349/g.26777 Transcript_10349/m.26777 type:complete len:277 (+) Transcript_10349:79-909(+)